MLITIGRCALRIEKQLYKRCYFSSTVLNTQNNDDFILQCDDNVTLRREDPKFLKVAILGLPNVGKSTLVNTLVRRNICPTSLKVHTTQHKAEAVYLEGDTQIVFVDTPGLVTNHELKKYKLMASYKQDPEVSASEADIIGVVQDVTNVYTRYKISDFVIDYLKQKKEDTPLLLILNKVDKLKQKQVLLELINKLTSNADYPKFDDIFMVSALSGDGVNDLRTYLCDCAKAKDWQYDQNLCTDQSIDTIVVETVRAKLLDLLQDEVPYNIQIRLEHLDIGEDGTMNILVSLNCDKRRYQGILLRKDGQMVKLVSQLTEKELQHAFRTNVVIRLSVICAKEKSDK
ncbi:PREDICTED: GTPase Era, mitochondrial [Dufourea novaeangliae]|uniref:GTPase Era, mitochondrial n=1 Tax=Dufourea novaeangliae TaxID=178035 RepID=A0A154PJB0_DUFNO|nr:PREDICTED: GTPase Era, mitochondrial [Dufourea novaeangliae]KZC11893.1 GTPase Era, mitochondrial [Dufourea novaeangliae]